MLSKQTVVFAALLLIALAVVLAAVFSGSTWSGPGTVTALSGAGLLAIIGIAGRILNAWRAPLLGALAVIALAMCVYGIATGNGPFALAGTVCLVLTGASSAVVFQLSELSSQSGEHGEAFSPPRLAHLLERIHEHSMLSETAKRVLFRNRELDLLRRSIEEDIERADYNAALRLCDDMADVFGFREEAEAFRSRIQQVRHEDYENQVRGALSQLESHLGNRDWSRAHEVAARIGRLFDDPHVREEVESRIAQSRAEHRRELEASFREAAAREDVELAMQRLRELDRYLTQEEAAQLAEVAQEVVSKHRENLSVQFKLAVNDHRWVDAARIGDAIMSEFPNTKMAEEVTSMIDVLRTRATQAAVAGEKAS
jgi:DNA-binding XRE family transcriptional regulator